MLSPAITIGDGSIRHGAKGGKPDAFGNGNEGEHKREREERERERILLIILINNNQIP
jgi:hypothetical protein